MAAQMGVVAIEMTEPTATPSLPTDEKKKIW